MDDFFNELEIINDYRIFIMSDHGSRITKQDISSFSTIFAYKDYMKQNSKIIWKIHQFRLYLKKSIMNDLTLIIPAKNESESLPTVLNSLKNLNLNIIISLKEDDLITINSIEKNEKIKLFFQNGTGYGNSLREAISYCKTKYFCIFNADGSFQNTDIFKMYELVKKNDFVYTTRYESLVEVMMTPS